MPKFWHPSHKEIEMGNEIEGVTIKCYYSVPQLFVFFDVQTEVAGNWYIRTRYVLLVNKVP